MNGRELKENTIRTFQQANIKFAYRPINSAQKNALVTITSNIKNCNLEGKVLFVTKDDCSLITFPAMFIKVNFLTSLSATMFMLFIILSSKE